MTQTVSSKSIQSLAASKVTGALPAVDGSALTGISAGVYNNASDPTITSNRDLGTLWANSVSGNLFICTDATSNSNVWVNVGSGSGDTTHAYGGMGGGTAYGFASCGVVPGLYISLINRFSFASGNAQTWGNASLARDTVCQTGASSSTHGFISNGYAGAPINAGVNVIDKFPFASGAGATDFGDLNFQRGAHQCSYDETRAYISGGRFQASPPHFTDGNIQTFLFANNSSNTNHGDLTRNSQWVGSQSSKTHGYVCGAVNGTIEKFAFASDAGGSMISGDLNGGVATTRFNYSTGHSSDTKGFIAGGSVANNYIDSFNFASDSAAGTSHGNLVKGTYTHAGSTSTTHGFLAGEDGGSTMIQRFSFDNNGHADDVGDLTRTYSACSGNED